MMAENPKKYKNSSKELCVLMSRDTRQTVCWGWTFSTQHLQLQNHDF